MRSPTAPVGSATAAHPARARLDAARRGGGRPGALVLFLAPTTGKWATAFGSAVHDPRDFWITMLNGITAAALYFVVASGFTLIFGLMCVVNMAHGAFFLFGGYVALKLQRNMVGRAAASA